MATLELQPEISVVCLAGPIVNTYDDEERRGHLRLSADDVRWLRSAKLKYGPEVRVIDISAGGILIETENVLQPDSSIVFELAGPTSTILVPSRVLRCTRVASFNAVARYQGACSFKRPLTIPELLKQAAIGTDARPAAIAPPTGSAIGWQKVIARFRDGRLVRGYTNDFHPSKLHLHLSAEPNATDTLFLKHEQLKALFFVREFVGNPSHVERKDFEGTLHGRKISVTFLDGETLIGSTLGFRGEGNGFFVHPADPQSNNLRVFVAPGSTQKIRFL
jgi:PilZ domain